MTSSMYYHPIFDKHGINTNPDGNLTSGEVTCLECKKTWTYSTRYSETVYKEIT